MHTFSATLKTAGSQSLVATDTATGNITGTQSGIVDYAAAASNFAVAGYPSPTTAGASGSYSVTAKDPFGNTVTKSTAMPRPDHVVVVVEENHSFGEIIGDTTDAPYLNTLAQRGALFTNSFGVTHPSQPNYLALFSGSTQGITDDNVHPRFSGANLGSELIAAGHSFIGYSQSLPSNGSDIASSGSYMRKHNPMTQFTNLAPGGDNSAVNRIFNTTNFPTSPGTDYSFLPTVSLVVPDQNNDMHDGSIATGDTWLKNNLGAYQQWAQTHNSLLIVTWDEDDSSGNNQIPTIFAGQMITAGNYSETINHYSVLRTIEDMYGLPYIGQDANAVSITNTNASTVYTGTAHFTSSDIQAVLPANYTFTAADAGMHTFSATLKTAGSQSLVATDTVTSSITGTQTITVQPVPGSVVGRFLFYAGSAIR